METDADQKPMVSKPTANDNSQESKTEKCPVCLGAIEDKTSVESCTHSFCRFCIKEWAKTRRNCPLCKGDMLVLVRQEDGFRETLPALANPQARFRAHPPPSTEILELRRHLTEQRARLADRERRVDLLRTIRGGAENGDQIGSQEEMGDPLMRHSLEQGILQGLGLPPGAGGQQHGADVQRQQGDGSDVQVVAESVGLSRRRELVKRFDEMRDRARLESERQRARFLREHRRELRQQAQSNMAGDDNSAESFQSGNELTDETNQRVLKALRLFGAIDAVVGLTRHAKMQLPPPKGVLQPPPVPPLMLGSAEGFDPEQPGPSNLHSSSGLVPKKITGENEVIQIDSDSEDADEVMQKVLLKAAGDSAGDEKSRGKQEKKSKEMAVLSSDDDIEVIAEVQIGRKRRKTFPKKSDPDPGHTWKHAKMRAHSPLPNSSNIEGEGDMQPVGSVPNGDAKFADDVIEPVPNNGEKSARTEKCPLVSLEEDEEEKGENPDSIETEDETPPIPGTEPNPYALDEDDYPQQKLKSLVVVPEKNPHFGDRKKRHGKKRISKSEGDGGN